MATYEHFFHLLNVDPNAPDWQIPGALRTASAQVAAAYGQQVPREIRAALEVLGNPPQRVLYKHLCELADAGAGYVELPAEFRDMAGEGRADHIELFHFRLTPLEQGVYRVERFSFECPDPPSARPPDMGHAAQPLHDTEEQPPQQARFYREPEAYGAVNGEPPQLVLGDRVFSWTRRYSLLKGLANLGDSMHITWYNRDTQVEWATRDYMATYWGEHNFRIGSDYCFTALIDTETRQVYEETMHAVQQPEGPFQYWFCWRGLHSKIPWDNHPDRSSLDMRFFWKYGAKHKKALNDVVVAYYSAVCYWTWVLACPDDPPEQLRDAAAVNAYAMLIHRCKIKPRELKKRYGLLPPAGMPPG